MRVLVYAENGSQLRGLAGLLSTLGLSAEATLVAGPRSSVVENAYKVLGRLHHVEAERLTAGQLAEALRGLYAEVSPLLVIGPASKNATDAGSRLAATHNLPMLTEARPVEVREDGIVAERQVLGGRAVARLRAGLPAVVTVDTRLYEEKAEGLEKGAEIRAHPAPPATVEILGFEPKKHEAVNIEEAEVVVGVGRGFRRKEDIAMAEELAELLGGVVGASRPIVADYGWLSEDRWIGISGKKIRPKLYIAIGISGAPQHMAAAMDSKIIVAINKDKNAPIFQYADYGVVADLYKFLPLLIKKLRERLSP